MDLMRPVHVTAVAGLLALAIAGCGGGDEDAAASIGAPAAVEDPLLVELKADGQDWDVLERYPDGSLRALGRLDEQGRPHGVWRWWYPEGGRWWEATCVAGRFDPDAEWTHYNPDGSIRARRGDGAPSEEPPL